MDDKKLTVGMVYDVFELGGGDTCAFNVYDKKGNKCIWRITPHTKGNLPALTEEQRNLEVCRITATASAIYLDVESDKYIGPYIHSTGHYY